MDLKAFQNLLTDALGDRIALSRFRKRRSVRAIDSVHLEVDGRTFVNFASNDYLGLSHHPAVIAATAKAGAGAGAGSGASALVTGYTSHHASAEAAIARWKHAEASVLLPSGYQANHAAIQTLAAVAEASSRRVRFLCDKLVHASLVDAVRATQATFRVFPHNQFEKLDRLLSDASPDEMQVVVTESIFSMDGDAADLDAIARLKQQHGFLLCIDEAHASGVYGANGAGLLAERDVVGLADVSIITLSKALGVAGGAIVGSRLLADAVVNYARAYIYSTSIPPALAAAIEAAVGVLHREDYRRLRVRSLAKRVRDDLTARGVALPPGDSPIIPILLGAEDAALREARLLEDDGIFVVAIRPPTVAAGTSRLRITLSSEHSDAEIERLLSHAPRWVRNEVAKKEGGACAPPS